MCQGSVCFNKSILGNLFCLFMVATYSQGKVIGMIFMLVNQVSKGILITIKDLPI